MSDECQADRLRREKPEANAGADIFLHPGQGGMMVWVRRDEAYPRAAIRVRGKVGLEEMVAMLGALEVGLSSLIKSTAARMSIAPDTFAEMVKIGADIIRENFPVDTIESEPG